MNVAACPATGAGEGVTGAIDAGSSTVVTKAVVTVHARTAGVLEFDGQVNAGTFGEITFLPIEIAGLRLPMRRYPRVGHGPFDDAAGFRSIPGFVLFELRTTFVEGSKPSNVVSPMTAEGSNRRQATAFIPSPKCLDRHAEPSGREADSDKQHAGSESRPVEGFIGF